ncbi:peptidoglycan recognition protein family protein [Sinorhizobium fredii]|uniref:N-acetylmuramoyl-L-alanine amidase domain-containing protein n=1 Tax=Rhizobium fredii TaxID=380 RepID=A0A2L0H4L9_RHIFR|nr:peptidoglycan-binding domain-containing protein [Sinorhizobium fredii]AUX76425.1 N-acetylmuramoyl-L-alanine amidase domain-containing protein [Sinorhizobium fredii]
MANRKRTTLGVVHVTATPPGWDKGVAGIRAIHKAQGWSDIGYNEIINADGRAEIGRGKMAIGAHVAGFNSISYGLAMVGGVDASGRPDVNTLKNAQFATLERRMRELLEEFPDIKWCGHRDLSPDKNGNGVIEPFEHIKACPCFDVIPWAAAKGLPVADIRGNWKPIVIENKPVIEGPDTRTAYLQRLLVRDGYALGPIDGIVGRKTRAAIRAFQLASNLPESGDFDAPTVSKLRLLFEAKATA